jgi:ABC-type lipoprotein export system ATPase subunit
VDSGKTILMVTHDYDLAGRALNTLVIADGEIVDQRANGEKRGVRHSSARYRSLCTTLK